MSPEELLAKIAQLEADWATQCTMTQLTLELLHQQMGRYAALERQPQALREEIRRYTAAQVLG